MIGHRADPDLRLRHGHREKGAWDSVSARRLGSKVIYGPGYLLLTVNGTQMW